MMMRYLMLAGLLGLLLAGGVGPAAAQVAPVPVVPRRTCATQVADAQAQAQLRRLRPGYNPAKRPARPAGTLRTEATSYTIPVIVHVVHNGEALGTGRNLSAAQVLSQLDVLNEDYNNANADGSLVPAVFQARRADAHFHFAPALRGPDGAPLAEPGIDRIDRHARGWGAPPYGNPRDVSYLENVIKPATFWNPDLYLNIWVLDLGGGLLGYAQFPDDTADLGGLSASGGLAATDGVVILYAAFGRVGTLAAGFDQGRTTTHEIGHWLGLRHTWGDDDCGNDYCADTPTQQDANFGCPSFPHVSCSNGAGGDMFMNYLDYVDDACMHLFTAEQMARMQAVMAAGTPRRSILAASPVASAPAVAWTGAAGTGSWFDAGNWTGPVPTRATNALIPAGLATPYPLLAGGTAEARTLTQQGPLTLTGGELALYGDYAGAGPLTQRGGVVATRGAGAQALRGGPYLALLVGGAGTKTIGAATIAQSLALSGAVLATGNDTITLAPTALITETETSYVLGHVQTTHAVGTAPDAFGGLGVRLTPAGAPGATTVARTTGRPPGAGSLSRYYDITAAVSRGLRGATLALSYLPHELNGLAETQLVLFKSADAGATWSPEGATRRDGPARLVSRDYVTDLAGRWTLGTADAPLAPAAIRYAINALPVPFAADGLALQVTTPTAGPLLVQLYDVLGRVIYDHSVANVEVGTSTVALPGSELLRPARYVLVVRQAQQEAHLNVVRE